MLQWVQFMNCDLLFPLCHFHSTCEHVWFIARPQTKVIISFALIKEKYYCNKSTSKSQTGYYRNTNEGDKNNASRDIVRAYL